MSYGFYVMINLRKNIRSLSISHWWYMMGFYLTLFMSLIWKQIIFIKSLEKNKKKPYKN